MSRSQVIDDVQDNVKSVGIQEKSSYLVYDSLKEMSITYNEDVMKTLAFLIITLGWFITSDKSRDFFRRNRPSRISSIIAVVVISIIHVRASVHTYLSSKKLSSLLDNMNYLDSELYNSYTIDIPQLVTNLIQNVVLFGVLIVILFTLKDVVTKSDTAVNQ